MILNIATDDVCKRCNQLIRTAFLTRHPTVPRMAQRSIECTHCGLSSVIDLPLDADREKPVVKLPTLKMVANGIR